MMAIFAVETAVEIAAAAEAAAAAAAAAEAATATAAAETAATTAAQQAAAQTAAQQAATAALTAGELGSAASGIASVPTSFVAPQSAMALDAAAGGVGSAAGSVPVGINQVSTLNLPPSQPFPYQAGLGNVPGAPVAPPPVAPPPGITSAPGAPSSAFTPEFVPYSQTPGPNLTSSPGIFDRMFGAPPTGADAYTATTAPGSGMHVIPGELGTPAAPTSAFERGLDKAMTFAQKNPLTAASLAYTGANALGLLNPNYNNFNSDPYSGPLSKYKLSPNYKATIANPSQYQYAPRYAEGGIMQMAQGGVTGSGNLMLNVPIDFGGGQNSTQSTPNYAFGNENSGANTGFFGQNSTQVNAPINPQNPTNSFMTQQAGAPDLMQSFQQLKPEAQSNTINVGGPAGINQDQNQPQRFARGGSTGNLSSTMDYYTKMMEGETPKIPAQHSTDVGIYSDTDPDTRSLDPYSAARVRQAKINKRAYVTAPKGPEPYVGGQLNLSPPGAKADGTQYQEAAKGGIMGVSDLGGYAAGGNPRLLKGPGDGMSDNIPATINGRQPARLADGEFVIPADVVSHLGNGSTEAGAKVLHQMMTKVRRERTGNPKQGKQINPHKYIPR
jgi:hypothetical protein